MESVSQRGIGLRGYASHRVGQCVAHDEIMDRIVWRAGVTSTPAWINFRA